ncbi:MAG: hypothetical protein JNK82_31180 [Myxococcaceae bacterium]|nr:hypothetical protein [Myxococcaceae bacterium]
MTRRGQTLVLFALLMLTTLVMALMTLSLAERAKERIELTSAADQAAWNNATATARMMNASALTTRAQLAHFVAVSGAASLISFAGSYRGYLAALEGYYAQERDTQARACRNGRRCGCRGEDEVEQRRVRVVAEQQRIGQFWAGLDAAAGSLVMEAGAKAFGMQGLANAHRLEHLFDRQLRGAALAGEAVARHAAGRPGWRAVPVDAVNLREVGPAESWAGAVIDGAKGRAHGVRAVMGSTGNAFTTARLDSAVTVQAALRRVTGNLEPVVFAHYGTAYFSGSFHGNNPGAVDKTASWADDHGLLGVQYRGNGCDAPARVLPVTGLLKSTDTSDGSDRHAWTPARRPGDDDGQAASTIHTANLCTNVECPAMFFYWQDYNQERVADREDLFGQPKNYAVAQLDRARAPLDPFQLVTRFRFSATGSGQTIDLQALTAADGTDLSKATALSTGLAYYHRKGHWREPPNLFNPFWRAGLVRGDIDAQARGGDLSFALGASDPVAADALRKLWAAGYRGVR